MKRSYLIAGIVVILLIAAAVFGDRLYYARNASETEVDPRSLDATIISLEQSIEKNPDNIETYIELSRAYIQKVRETADISYYRKIDELLDTAEKVAPNNPDVYAARTSVALGRHNFTEAKEYIQKAVNINTRKDYYYGLLGDAEIELGNYDAAVAAYQKMVDIRPDFNSYSRIAYIRELYGDIPGAKKAMQDAIGAGTSFPENTAWAYVELGKLEMRTSLEEAQRNFNKALSLVDEYAPAYEGLGKVAFFQNNLTDAENYFKKAYEALPIAQYATSIGDLYKIQGKETEAQQYYTITELAFKASASSGVNVELEEALFLSERDIDLPRALSQAQKAYKERKSMYTADYLSWALYKNGKFKDAQKYTQQALRLGEHDSLVLFHQGMIALKNNDKQNAKKYLTKALEVDPYFSLFDVKTARDTLKNI